MITRKPKSESSAEPTLSKMQQTCAARIERKLKESKYSYDFDKAPLAKVAAFFEQQSNENVVLDPRGRLQGKIDPEATITGSGKDVPFGEALEKLVAPLGLHGRGSRRGDRARGEVIESTARLALGSRARWRDP